MFSVFQYIFWTVVVYIYLNNPLLSLLGGNGLIKLLYPFALFSLLLNSRKVNSFLNDYKYLIVVFFFIWLFHFAHYAFGASFDFFYSSIVAFLEIVIVPYWLSLCIVRRRLSFYRILYLIAAFASIISLLCFISPELNSFVKLRLLIASDFLLENDFRGFGISDSLTYAYGVILGSITALWFVKNKDDKWFIVFIPIVVFSILVNARVGLLIPFIFLLYVLYKKRSIKYLIGYSLVIGIAVFVIGEVLKSGDEQTSRWIGDFFEEISIFSAGNLKDSGTANALLNKMIIWPDNFLQWILGRGESLYLKAGQNSDVGFILQLNYGGLVYVVLLLLLLFLFFKFLFLFKEYDLLVLVIIICCIANLKGDFIPNSGGFRLLVLLIMIMRSSYKEVSAQVFISK